MAVEQLKNFRAGHFDSGGNGWHAHFRRTAEGLFQSINTLPKLAMFLAHHHQRALREVWEHNLFFEVNVAAQRLQRSHQLLRPLQRIISVRIRQVLFNPRINLMMYNVECFGKCIFTHDSSFLATPLRDQNAATAAEMGYTYPNTAAIQLIRGFCHSPLLLSPSGLYFLVEISKGNVGVDCSAGCYA